MREAGIPVPPSEVIESGDRAADVFRKLGADPVDS